MLSSNSSSPYLLTRLLPNAQHCFVSLPRGTFTAQLQARDHTHGCMVLMLEWSDSAAAAAPASATAPTTAAPATPASTAPLRRVYVGWLGEYLPDDASSGSSMGSLGLPASFAQSLAIPAGVRVQVTPLPDRAPPAGIGMITLEPVSSDDWEILELNAGAVEMGLLSQSQVLNPGQVIPFWLSSTTRIRLKNATDMTHAGKSTTPFVKLTLNSEVSIVPKPRVSKRSAALPAAPTGPPPPIARLRVQPRQSTAVRAEITQQQRRARDEMERSKDAQRAARLREWDEKQSAAFGGGVDSYGTLQPPPPAAPPAVHEPLCTLASPHHVHVSRATMRFMGARPDDLVVLSFVRRATKAIRGPIPAPAAASETLTTVLRVAHAECVFDENAEADLASPAAYLAASPHHILLPASLRLAFGVSDFAWVHLQRLTSHNLAPNAASSVRQSLCVRESMQRLQNIRLKELDVHATRDGSDDDDAARRPTNSEEQTGPSAARAQQMAEDDARRVSDAFIRYVRGSTSSVIDPVMNPTNAPLAVPFVNGGFISLVVPTQTSTSADGLISSRARPEFVPRLRFFSVHFNEADLLAASAKSGILATNAPQAPSSLLDTTVLATEAASATDANATPVSGGVKMSMATTYFLVQAPPAPDAAAAAKKKSKKAPVIPPLPVPLLHATKVPVDIQTDQFEDVWDPSADAVDDDSADAANSARPSASSPHVAFHELGGSPAYRRAVVTPLVRFLKSALCHTFIRDRGDVLRSSPDSRGLTAGPTSLGGMMVVGSKGKSALLWSLCRLLRVPSAESLAEFGVPLLAQPVWVDCKLHLGAKLSDLRALFSRLLTRARHAAPGATIIVMEDLDKLIPPSQENDGGAGLRSTQIAESLLDALSGFQSQHPSVPLAVVAICASTSSHHPLANLAFPHVVTVPNPSAADRVAIFAAIAQTMRLKLSGKVEMSALGRKTEGYTASDIKQLVSRTAHASLVRTLAQATVASNAAGRSLTAEPADLDAAFRGFVPSSLKELASTADSAAAAEEVGWEDIGGLFSVKSTLLDTFELPVRYAELFARAPLKLRSGLLLYGPSGVGKTLIASHIAARCGLNFLSVKGPELLNKYIGSSEANVRDIFQRARNAAPALLFFDEMDSIVPARGGDSTGVTDRVVNQFLCELDGVEGKIAGAKPLYVLGASSRPDLIDPALLRPGRLDKSIYCGLPARDERLDMLRCMTRRLTLSSDVDLGVIADGTADYTPADIQAIVTNAQMGIVQEVIAEAQKQIDLAKSGAASATTGAPNAPLVLPPLTHAHLMRAFQESTPSTTPAERARADKIYDKFRLSREDNTAPDRESDFDPTVQKQMQA